jgi:uncharacterized protein YndB with AHSA1/START domain
VSVHTNEHTIEIARPAPHVFAYLAASERRQRWMSALKESEQVSEGPLGLGTRFRDVFEDHGQRFEIDAEIVAWEPHEKLAIDLKTTAFESRVTQLLAPGDNGGTRLTTLMETEYKSALARLMAGVVTNHAQKQLEEDLARLRDILETG